MGRLALVWDAPWLLWTTVDANDVSRREISNPDMVAEVLRALRQKVGVGAEVIHAEWAKPATVGQDDSVQVVPVGDVVNRESQIGNTEIREGRILKRNVETVEDGFNAVRGCTLLR